MSKQNNSSGSRNAAVLVSSIIFLLYFLFDKHQDNERMYKICKDQEETIQELQKAISLQQFYIKQLESISGLNYNK
jgi:hypothetical protein|tara:strand:+ start:1261 stop:1488 length:228 start_codon:yes stop_codon:yes gene_type:complete